VKLNYSNTNAKGKALTGSLYSLHCYYQCLLRWPSM